MNQRAGERIEQLPKRGSLIEGNKGMAGPPDTAVCDGQFRAELQNLNLDEYLGFTT
jgi:hypothetical protein